jgi:hypothetical protein
MKYKDASMNNEDDPFDKLSTSMKAVETATRLRLASLILMYIRIDFNLGEIILLPRFNELPDKQKVLVFLISKLIVSLKNEKFSSEASPNEIYKKIRISGPTCRARLGDLVREGVISKGDEGYAFQLFSLDTAERILPERIES